MVRFRDVGGFILAGGASSRMGRDKVLLELGGVPLVVRAARLLEPLVRTPTLIGPPKRYRHLGLPVFPDDHPGYGPLGGISTALRLTANTWNLVVGTDLPFLSAEWLGYLIRLAVESASDALIPESERGAEPLCAMYHRRCGPAVAAALARGVRKVTDGFAGLAVEPVQRDAWRAFDSDGRLFKNINAPADYEEAQALFSRKAAR